jgi:histidine triad (HIT) family protein
MSNPSGGDDEWMPTLFTRIIDGELPAEFVWTDDVCVGFLSINPLSPGHTLVVPRLEIDEWLDCPDDVRDKLVAVAQLVGRAIKQAFNPARVGLIIAGFEVPHLHLHVFGVNGLGDFDFRQAGSASADALGEAAARLRAALGTTST